MLSCSWYALADRNASYIVSHMRLSCGPVYHQDLVWSCQILALVYTHKAGTVNRLYIMFPCFTLFADHVTRSMQQS